MSIDLELKEASIQDKEENLKRAEQSLASAHAEITALKEASQAEIGSLKEEIETRAASSVDIEMVRSDLEARVSELTESMREAEKANEKWGQHAAALNADKKVLARKIQEHEITLEQLNVEKLEWEASKSKAAEGGASVVVKEEVAEAAVVEETPKPSPGGKKKGKKGKKGKGSQQTVQTTPVIEALPEPIPSPVAESSSSALDATGGPPGSPLESIEYLKEENAALHAEIEELKAIGGGVMANIGTESVGKEVLGGEVGSPIQKGKDVGRGGDLTPLTKAKKEITDLRQGMEVYRLDIIFLV